MEKILDFYLRLAQNNNKPWFDEHRAEYEKIKQKVTVFAEQFIEKIAKFDPLCKDLQVRDCTYRINRDIRFSPDKRPYKYWVGVYVCPRGKKSGMAGYYVHFEPISDTYFVCAGLYNPTKEVLKSVREYISLEPEKFHAAVEACGKGFRLNWENALRRMPAGFDENDKHSEYYRLKTYDICKSVTREDVLKDDFMQKAVAYLKKCHSYNDLLNQCFEYVH